MGSSISASGSSPTVSAVNTAGTQTRAGESEMGFCSGTDIFDPVIKVIIESTNADISPTSKVVVVKSLINALEDHDWDCQDDSTYYNHPIVKQAMRELHPDWFRNELIP